MFSAATSRVRPGSLWVSKRRPPAAEMVWEVGCLGGDGWLTGGIGHEFTGTVEEAGSEVKKFKKGDQIVSPFTVCW